MIISYHCQGRLGNNIFQYIAVKVVQKYINDIYKFDKCNYEFNHRESIFSEFQYLQFYHLLKHCLTNGRIEGILSQFTSINWFFDGFFQFDEHIRDNLDFVKSLFTEDNEERINNEFRVCDIVKRIQENKVSFHPDDIVTHVRLDDFKNGNNILDWKYVVYIMKGESKIYKQGETMGKIYVVVDKLKGEFEYDYIKEMLLATPFKLITNEDMFKDLAYLWYAPNLICNNSTFCWLGYIFGENKKSWMPKNLRLNPPQHFETVKQETIVYEWNTWKWVKNEALEEKKKM